MENYLNNGYWLYWNWAEATVALNGRLGYGGRRLPGTIQTRLQNRTTRPPAGMQNRLKCPPAQRAPPALLGSHQAVGGARTDGPAHLARPERIIRLRPRLPVGQASGPTDQGGTSRSSGRDGASTRSGGLGGLLPGTTNPSLEERTVAAALDLPTPATATRSPCGNRNVPTSHAGP